MNLDLALERWLSQGLSDVLTTELLQLYNSYGFQRF